MKDATKVRKIDFVELAREDQNGFPESVKENIGYGLFLVQRRG